MTNFRKILGGSMLMRRFLHESGAVAAAEMAMIFPIFAYVSLNIMDLGVYIYSRMQTELAAEAAVGTVRSLCNTSTLLPATNPTGHCSATLTAQMTAAAQTTSLGTGVTLGTPTEGYYCASAAGALVQVAAITATPPANCSSVVTGSTTAPGDYISVAANYTYIPFSPGMAITAALPTAIRKTAWMRLQ